MWTARYLRRPTRGAGTLYRHFPTREDLVLTVYRHDMQCVVDLVPKLLAEHEPLDAFRHWFETLADYVRIKHGLGEALTSANAQAVIGESSGPVTAAVGELLRACEAAESVRPGLDPADVLLLMSFMWRTGKGQPARERARRLMELAIDGLNAH